MNWDQIAGKWQEFKGKAKQRWGKLTDQDLVVIAGKRDVLAGKIVERMGIAKEQAEKELAEFEASCCATVEKTVEKTEKVAEKVAGKPTGLPGEKAAGSAGRT